MTRDEVKKVKAGTKSRAVKRSIDALATADRYAAKFHAKLDAIAGDKRLAEAHRDLYRASLADLTGGQSAELERLISPDMYANLARLNGKQ